MVRNLLESFLAFPFPQNPEPQFTQLFHVIPADTETVPNFMVTLESLQEAPASSLRLHVSRSVSIGQLKEQSVLDTVSYVSFNLKVQDDRIMGLQTDEHGAGTFAVQYAPGNAAGWYLETRYRVMFPIIDVAEFSGERLYSENDPDVSILELLKRSGVKRISSNKSPFPQFPRQVSVTDTIAQYLNPHTSASQLFRRPVIAVT